MRGNITTVEISGKNEPEYIGRVKDLQREGRKEIIENKIRFYQERGFTIREVEDATGKYIEAVLEDTYGGTRQKDNSISS